MDGFFTASLSLSLSPTFIAAGRPVSFIRVHLICLENHGSIFLPCCRSPTFRLRQISGDVFTSSSLRLFTISNLSLVCFLLLLFFVLCLGRFLLLFSFSFFLFSPPPIIIINPQEKAILTLFPYLLKDVLENSERRSGWVPLLFHFDFVNISQSFDCLFLSWLVFSCAVAESSTRFVKFSGRWPTMLLPLL
jgi:hypothetical protein